MRSAAAAIGWEFRRRHRWGIVAVTGYLLVLALLKLLDVRLHEESFAFLVIVPMWAAFIYFLAVFTFGLDADVAARRSIYPARMFALPVTTGALAGWPMLFGSAVAAILWFAIRALGVWPADVAVPVIWPALLAASLLGWTQALTWMPYALPGLRVIVTAIWLSSIDTLILLALQLKVSEPAMVAVLLPNIPLAYLAARFAVARARRGDIPHWRQPLGFLPAVPRSRGDFLSPDRAQAWFEWRLHGRSLPALVAILLPFEMAMLFLFRDTPAIVFEMLLCAVVTPPFVAAFAAATVGRPNPPFLATRPLSSASLVAAKLKATFASTLTTWALVAITVPIALRFSGTTPLVMEWVHDATEILGAPRSAAVALLGLFALMAATWKQLVQSLYIGMTGREWLVKTSVLLALLLLVLIGPVAEWISRSDTAIEVLWNALPWIAAILVGLKLAAAARIAVRLRDLGLFDTRTLIFGAACWDVLVFAFYSLLAWIFPALLVPRYVLLLVAILSIPLARLSAAPLAVAWSRHR